MVTKTVMCLFDVAIHNDYKDFLLQELAQIKVVHIRPKEKIIENVEKGDRFSEKIKTLRSEIERLFKMLNITDNDIQRLNVKKKERIEFVVKDILELINYILEEINFYNNRVAELGKYVAKVNIEQDKMKIIEESYNFLNNIGVSRDNLSQLKQLSFRVFTTFSKNLVFIKNLFDFSNFPNFFDTQKISEDRIVFFTIYPKDKEEDLKEKLRVIQVEEVPILKKYLLIDGINFPRIKSEINFITNTLIKYEKELERLRDDNIILFAAMYEIVQNIEDYDWAENQFRDISSNASSLQFFIPVGRKEEVRKRLIDVFKDKINIHSMEISKKTIINVKEKEQEEDLKEKSYSKYKLKNKEVISSNVEADEDLREKTPRLMKNNFFVRPFETLTRMYGTPSYSEIDPTPFLALIFPILFGLMFGDIGHGIVLIIAGLIGAVIFRNKKGTDFLNFCWIIFYCGLGAVLFGFLYGEFFGMHDIEIGGQVFLHLNPVTIPILNMTLHNPISRVTTVLIFAILIGVIHINLGWIIQFLNYWRQARKYLAITDSLVKIFLLIGGTILILNYKFDINAWVSPPFPILLPLIPGILLLILKPIGKILGVSYMKAESYKDLVSEGSMETFETLLSVISNVASYIRLLALALAHIALMIAIQAMTDLIEGSGFWVEFAKSTGLIFGNIVVILIEGLLVFLNALRLNFYEFFFKFYSGSGTKFYPFYLGDNFSIINFKLSDEKDIVSEEIEREIESKQIHEDILEATKQISKKYF
ncbi:MAG: V-type ATP synthase subunit I [Promethearchaeota archaeon]